MHGRDGFELLPLRQMVSATGDAALVFARQELLDWLSVPECYLIVSHGQGGQILAAGELALVKAQLVLREAYGALITFGTTTVHTYEDAQAQTLMVPIMFLRVDAPRRHVQQLLNILKERAAEMREVEVQGDRVVMRAELEFSRALGLEPQIEQLTDGSAQILSWLLRYQRTLHRTGSPHHRSPARDEQGMRALIWNNTKKV